MTDKQYRVRLARLKAGIAEMQGPPTLTFNANGESDWIAGACVPLFNTDQRPLIGVEHPYRKWEIAPLTEQLLDILVG